MAATSSFDLMAGTTSNKNRDIGYAFRTGYVLSEKAVQVPAQGEETSVRGERAFSGCDALSGCSRLCNGLSTKVSRELGSLRKSFHHKIDGLYEGTYVIWIGCHKGGNTKLVSPQLAVGLDVHDAVGSQSCSQTGGID